MFDRQTVGSSGRRTADEEPKLAQNCSHGIQLPTKNKYWKRFKRVTSNRPKKKSHSQFRQIKNG